MISPVRFAMPYPPAPDSPTLAHPLLRARLTVREVGCMLRYWSFRLGRWTHRRIQ